YVDLDDWGLAQVAFNLLEERHKLFCTQLGNGKQLYMPTIGTNSSCTSLHIRNKSCGNYNHPKMGLSSVVVDANTYAEGIFSTALGTASLHKGFFRRSRTLKESKMAVPSSKNTLAAVSREHLEYQLPDPSKEYRVKRVYKALLK
ncbi:11165_t:CDS:2, partial [Dentiscutata heterogama]